MPPLIICERHGYWAAAVRRYLVADTRIVETRAYSQLASAEAEHPQAMVAIELNAENQQQLLDYIAEREVNCPEAPLVVLTWRGCESWEPLIREAGAVEVLYQLRSAPRLAELFARYQATLPVEETDLLADIWQRLPWSP